MIPEEQGRLCGSRWGPWDMEPRPGPVSPRASGARFFPLAHYVHTIATAHYGTSLQGLAWAAATLTRLSLGQGSAGLGGLRRMQPTADEAAQAIANGGE